MAPPEANIEMVVMARTLPNDCIDFSIPGGLARAETAIAILFSKRQHAKIVEVQRKARTDSGGRAKYRVERSRGFVTFPNTTVKPRRRRRVGHEFKHSYLLSLSETL